ncbi:polysaccharide deacetylase family protein [Nostoc sp. DedQUE09]|uniref:polysaccharide deacetylase family protein n=1 Tax=Nostoc sp. DedQUE09 TaxID=3075394 RepID=UPI002AD57CBA|nr:polysaccharide deacetylase family protein [Nostoc sp. DedQUE09]MDZ7949480.1 polysaccharide deacetylase family protein [Nostoc sp. DedQUE09]
MKISFTGKLHRKLKQFQKRFASKSLILMYHRVAEIELDPWSLCVTPQHFAEHLEVLQKYAYPISLLQLAQAHRDGNIPHRAVAITFDDGYADNLHHAKPLLERYGIPATVFISTDYIGKKREFWWDELERVLLQPGKLPEKLILNISANIHHWELGAAVDYSPENYQCDRTSQAWKAKPGSRMYFYYSIWQILRPLPEAQRQNALDEILTWATAEPKPRSTHRSLLPEELSALGQGELVEIGAHTVTHPFLSAQSTTLQRHEIKQSKVDLEETINRPVTSFSYPFGDRTAETIELAKASGFSCACSTVQDIVWQQSNRFDLPRFGVENWNGEEFAKQLLRWFHG